MNLFSYKGKKYSTQDLKNARMLLGVCKNDDVNIHSELLRFGKPLLEKDALCKEIINTFKKNTNALIMPTFTYSFCQNEIYDIENFPNSDRAYQ